MSIYIGNNKIKDIYVGNTKIKEGYVGSNKVFGNVSFDPANFVAMIVHPTWYATSNWRTPRYAIWNPALINMPGFTQNVSSIYLEDSTLTFGYAGVSTGATSFTYNLLNSAGNKYAIGVYSFGNLQVTPTVTMGSQKIVNYAYVDNLTGDSFTLDNYPGASSAYNARTCVLVTKDGMQEIIFGSEIEIRSNFYGMGNWKQDCSSRLTGDMTGLFYSGEYNYLAMGGTSTSGAPISFTVDGKTTTITASADNLSGTMSQTFDIDVTNKDKGGQGVWTFLGWKSS